MIDLSSFSKTASEEFFKNPGSSVSEGVPAGVRLNKLTGITFRKILPGVELPGGPQHVDLSKAAR